MTLHLDNEYSAMLTDKTSLELEKTLEQLLGKIKLNIVSKTISEPTPTKIQQQHDLAEQEQRAQKFLQDKGLQKLQTLFDAEVDIITVGERNV